MIRSLQTARGVARCRCAASRVTGSYGTGSGTSSPSLTSPNPATRSAFSARTDRWRTGEFVGQDPDLGISVIHVHGMPSLRPLAEWAPAFPPSPSWILTISYPGSFPSERTTPHLAVARTDKEIGYAGRMRGEARGRRRSRTRGWWRSRWRWPVGRRSCSGRAARASLLLDPRRKGIARRVCDPLAGPERSGVDRSDRPARARDRCAPGLPGDRARVSRRPGRRARSGRATEDGARGPDRQRPFRESCRAGGSAPGRSVGRLRRSPRAQLGRADPEGRGDPAGQVVRVDLMRANRVCPSRSASRSEAHSIWRQKQRQMTNGREKMLRHQMEGFRQQLELLRHQLLSAY